MKLSTLMTDQELNQAGEEIYGRRGYFAQDEAAALDLLDHVVETATKHGVTSNEVTMQRESKHYTDLVIHDSWTVTIKGFKHGQLYQHAESEHEILARAITQTAVHYWQAYRN